MKSERRMAKREWWRVVRVARREPNYSILTE